MIKRLYVDNYKCLVNFEARLDELTLLLGPNGVGKSSVLEVTFALRQLLSGVGKITDAELFPTRSLTRWRQGGVLQVFEVVTALEDDEFTYRLEVEHDPQTRRARVMLERLEVTGGRLFEFHKGDVHLYRDDHSRGPTFKGDWSESALARVAPTGDNTRLTRFVDSLRKVVVCSPYPRSFVTEASTEDPMLSRDGANLTAWCRHLFQERQDLVQPFTEALRGVIDGFQAIRLEKVGQDTRALMLVFEAESGRFELRLDELSDGQRALIGLYALLHLTAGQGFSLFLDEPDNYVALAEIQPWLNSLSDACGEEIEQAVVCSHHPELIDHLGGDHGLLLSRESSGAVVARRLDPTKNDAGMKLSELVARGWER